MAFKTANWRPPSVEPLNIVDASFAGTARPTSTLHRLACAAPGATEGDNGLPEPEPAAARAMATEIDAIASATANLMLFI